MAMREDRRGLALTVASEAAAHQFDCAVDAVLGHRADCASLIADALRADPGFLLAHCLKGFACLIAARQELLTDAVTSLASARDAERSRDATPREMAYVDALAAWCAGDMRRAGDILSAQLRRDPRDLLAIKLHQAVHFMLGDQRAMLDTLRDVIGAWDETVPGFGFVQGCFAFALEETGAYDSAERLGRRACELSPSDIWAAHAVAHVFEMRGEPRSGLRWLERRADAFVGCNNLTFHLAWHRALFHLALDQFEQALVLYDHEIRVHETEDYRDTANAASLLSRLQKSGVDVGRRWRELADKAALRLDDPSLVFASVHYLASLIGDGRHRAAESLVLSLRRHAGRRATTQSHVFETIGLPLAEAMLAASHDQPERVVDLLFPVRDRIVSIGGSNAQRDLFSQLLIDAAIDAGRRSEALILLRERSFARPQNDWGAARLARLTSDRRSDRRRAI
jgi:tetratricopeptide (TPR) repeat protein